MGHYKVILADIEAALIALGGNSSSKQIQNMVLEKNCNGKIPENYQDERSFRQTIQRIIEQHCPQASGYDSSKKEAKFVRVGRGVYEVVGVQMGGFTLAEELSPSKSYHEGTTKPVLVNAYERNGAARQKCIAHHGLKCSACGFNFESFYGKLGKDYIHVHHLTPLSTIKSDYVVDPVADLRPLCANCHSIIHRSDTPLSIEELISAINAAKP